MRRVTIVLLGVAVSIAALVGSSALSQEVFNRVLFGEISFVGPGGESFGEIWEISPISFTANVQAPQSGIGKSREFEMLLIGDPLNNRATFVLQGQNISVCSAHGPQARIDGEFEFGGLLDTNSERDPQIRVFGFFFQGSSPAEPTEMTQVGNPDLLPLHHVFSCGKVIGETVEVSCSEDRSKCTSDLTMHGFVHAHGTFGNYIGPTTVRVSHNASSKPRGLKENPNSDVEVRIIIPDGEVLIQGSFPPGDTVYWETSGTPGVDLLQDCFAFPD